MDGSVFLKKRLIDIFWEDIKLAPVVFETLSENEIGHEVKVTPFVGP